MSITKDYLRNRKLINNQYVTGELIDFVLVYGDLKDIGEVLFLRKKNSIFSIYRENVLNRTVVLSGYVYFEFPLLRKLRCGEVNECRGIELDITKYLFCFLLLCI